MAGNNLHPSPERVKPTRSLDSIIKRAVLRELRRQEGNLSRTARELAISRQTLLNYMDAWGLRVERNGKVWRLLPGELQQERALERKFSHKVNHSRYEPAHAYWRRRDLEDRRCAVSELDYIREVMCGL